MELPTEKPVVKYTPQTLDELLIELLKQSPHAVRKDIIEHKKSGKEDYETAFALIQSYRDHGAGESIKDPWTYVLRLYRNKNFAQLIAIQPEHEYYKSILNVVNCIKSSAADRKIVQAAGTYLKVLCVLGNINPKTFAIPLVNHKKEYVRWLEFKTAERVAYLAAMDEFNSNPSPFIMGKGKTSQELDQPPRKWWCNTL